jgi:thioredoxin 1
MSPVLSSVLENFMDIQLESVNVEEDPDKAVEFKIRSIPTLVLTKDGEAVGKLMGARSAEEIEAFLQEFH